MNKTNQNYYTLVCCVFVALSFCIFFFSNASPLVKAIAVGGIFISYVVPGLLAINVKSNIKFVIWFVGGMLGIIVSEIAFSSVIVKYDQFANWHIIYPLGLSLLLFLQYCSSVLSRKK